MRAGADLREANMTVAAATQWGIENTSCAGFTAQGNSHSTCAPETVAVPAPVLHFYFKSRAGGNSDAGWTTWTKPAPPGTLIATGPPGGMMLAPQAGYPSGRIVAEYYKMGGLHGSSSGALLSDDLGNTFRPSSGNLP